MRNRIWRGFAAVTSAGILAVLASAPAEATHFRGGNIYAESLGGNIYQITIETYWRRSYAIFNPPNTSSPLNVGDMFTPTPGNVDFSYNLGEGANITGQGQVISVNAAEDWFGLRYVTTHTYTTAGTFDISLVETCCRLFTQNSSNSWYELHSTINVGSGQNTPNVNNSSPIFLVPDGGVQVFNPFSATDPDGGPLTYAFSDATKSGSGFVVPAGMSIDSATGNVTWDTDAAGANIGELFTVAFIVTDAQGNTAPLDILLRMCEAGTAGCGAFVPPTETVPAPGALSIAGLGLLGVAALRRRRQR